MDNETLRAEIESKAAALSAALGKLPEGPHRNIALSQVAEAVRLAQSALPDSPAAE